MAKITTQIKNGKVYTYRDNKLFSIQPVKKTTEKKQTSGYGTSKADSVVTSSIKSTHKPTSTVQGWKSTSQNSLTAKAQNTVKKSGAETAQNIGRDSYAQNHQGQTYVAGSGNQERKLDSKKYYMGNSETARAANEYERANDELKIYDQEHSWVNTVNQQQDALRRGDDAALSAATQQGKQNNSERNTLAKKVSDAQEKVFSAQRKEIYDTTNAKANTAASSDPNYSATVQRGLQNERIQGSGNGLTITGMRETASPDRRDVVAEGLQGDWLEASELLTNRLNSVGDVDAYKQTEEYQRLYADSEAKRKKYTRYMDDTSWYGYAKKFGVLDQLGYAAATLNEKDFDAYFKNLQLDLTAKGAEQQEKELKDITGGDNPNALQRGTAAIMNVALQTSPTAGADYGDTLGKSIYNATHDVEDRLPTNPYGNTGQARLQNLTQEQASVGLNDVQKFFMNAGLSSASMVLGAATGGGTYIYNQGLGAGSQAAQDALEKGGDYGQAAATGTAAAAAATLMEKVGIDNIFGAVGELGINGSTAKNIAKAFLKSAASEGTEEAGEEVVNIVADMLVMGDKSDVQQYLNDYINNNQNSTKAQQDAALAMYAFSRIGQNALAGAITGGAFGGATMLGAYGDYGTAATAEDVKSLYRESAKENGIDLTGKSEKGIAVGAAQELITQAYSKEAKKAVETAQKQIEIKQEVSDAALTNLFNTVMSDKNRTAAQKAADADAYINAGTDFYLNNPVEETISTPVLDKYAGGQNVDAILGRMYTTNMPTIERMAGKEAVLNAGGEEVAPTGKDVKMPTRREAGSIEITEPGNRARYENEIDGVFNGKLPLGSEIIMGRTPETLTLYGAPDLPLHMTQATARKIAYPKGYQGGEHNLGIEALKQLPDQLSNPIAILESKTQPNSHVVLTEWNDTNGNRVVVPIHFNKNGTMTVQNKIASAYGKEGINALLGENNENVIYTKNNEDIQSLLSHGLQLPEASRDDVFYNPNISQDTPGVKDSLFQSGETDTQNQKYDIMSEEGDSDQEYTDKNTITKYKGFDAYNLNYQLNNGQELDADSLKWSNELSDALSSLPDYNGHTYRTLVFDDFGGKDAYDAFVSKHVIGYEVTYNGFTSSVKSENGYPIDGQYKVFLRIDGAHGKDIGTMLPGQQDAEGEVLFDKKSIFIPTKIYEQNGVLNIEIKEVAESEDAFSSGKKSMVSAVSERNTPSAMQQVRTSGKRINGGQQTGVQSVSAGNTESNNGRGREPLRGALSGGQRDIGGKERITKATENGGISLPSASRDYSTNTYITEENLASLGENARDGMTKEDLNSLAATEPHKGKAELLNPTQAAEAQTEIMKKASAAELEEARRISEESVEVNPTKKKTPVRESAAAALDWFERKFVDSGHEVAKQSPRAEHYYNAVRGATQAADYAIGRTNGRKTHQTDIFGMGNKGESLTTIFEPINAKGEAYAAAFNKYMYHKHNVDRMGLVERAREKIAALEDEKTKLMENPLVKGEMEELESGAISTLEISDELKSVLRLESTIEALASVENKPIFGRDVTAQASREIAAEILRANPEFARFETRVRKYLKGNMELRVQSGLVSQELADALEEIYPNYVPIFRAGGSESNYSHDNLTVGKTLGRAVGGDGPIGNLEDSIAAQTRSIYKNGRKNIATEALMDALAKNGNLKEMVSGERYKQEKSEFKTDKNTIMFYQKGDMVELTVTPEIAEAFRAFNGVQENKGAVTIRKVNEVYKKLITQYNPTFIVRNFLKDWQDAVIYSKFGVKAFAKNYGRALAGIKNNSAEWQLYCASGGFASSIFENYAETQVENRGKKRNVLQKGVDKISQANMVVEQAPRFAEFLATMEAHGMNAGNVTQDVIMEALYNANDITCNFGRSGTVGKYVNKYAVPFFNPSIQGFDKLVRTFKAKDAKSCVRAFVGFAAKSAMIGLVPSILNELMHLLSDDDEEKEAWERLSDYTKNTYYCFYIGDGQFFKLPKGRIASIIGNLGQGIARDMLAQSEEDKNDWGAYGSAIVNNVAPTNPLENFIGASLVRTLGQNKKWTGQTIETDEDKKKPVAERYDETTSETAKFMSKNMGLANIGLSPKQIETLIDEGTGVVGDIVLPMTSAQAQQSPIVNSFVTDSNVKNKRSGQVYDLKTQLAQEAYMEGESDVPSQTDLALDFIADSQKAVWDNKDKIKEINMQPITAQEIGRRIFGNSDRTKEVSALNLENARINEKILTRYDAFRESLEKNYRVDSSADVDTQKAQVKLAYLKAYREAMGDEATVENVLTDSQKKYCTAAKTKGVDTKTYLDYVEATNGMTKDADRVSALVKMGLPEEKTKSIYEAAIQSSKIKEENSIAYAQRQGISTMEFLKTKYDLDDAALSTTQKTKEAGSSTVIKQAAGYDIPEYKTETLAKIKNAGVSVEDYAYVDDRLAGHEDKVDYIRSLGFDEKQTAGLVQSLVMGSTAKKKMLVASEDYGISSEDYVSTYIAGYASVGSKAERNAQIRAYVDGLNLSDEQKDALYNYNKVSKGKTGTGQSENSSSGASGRSSGGRRSGGSAKKKALKVSVPSVSTPAIRSATTSANSILQAAMKKAMSRENIQNKALASQKEAIQKNLFMTAKQKAAAIRRLEQ